MTSTQNPDKSTLEIGFADPDDYARMKDVLIAVGFTDDGIRQACGSDSILSVTRQQLPGLLRRTDSDTPRDTLIRVFLLGVAVDLSAARDAVSPMSLEAWGDAGLITVDGDRVSSRVHLICFCGIYFASDLPLSLSENPKSDFVMGLGTSTMTLAGITVRQPIKNALDLGAGCGVHAFLAAPHSRHVVAADRNPRATGFALFNARLNGLTNVECVTGDLFEPVKGRRFDLIVSNPPFVISPSSRYIYRDSGVRGDEFCRRLAREVPDYLEEGGFCQFMCNWAQYANQDWDERLPEWFEGIGCDVWVMRTVNRDASNYASTWISRTEFDRDEDFHHTYNQWMDYYEKEGIEQISGGLITMRKATARDNWFIIEDAPPKMIGDCGPDVLLGFSLREYLHRTPDPGLFDDTFRVSPSVRLNQTFESKDGRWEPGDGQISRVSGLGYAGQIDHHIAGLIAGCSGEVTLRTLIEDIAAKVNQDFDAIAPQAAKMARQLIDQAILLPSSIEPLSQ